jgi:hypothetical protein
VFMYQDNIMMRNQGLGAHYMREKHKDAGRRLELIFCERQKRAQSVFSSSQVRARARKLRCWCFAVSGLVWLAVVVHSALCVWNFLNELNIDKQDY